MKTKKCSQCNQRKNISNFYFRKDQNNYRRNCKKCISVKGKERYKKHKKEFQDFYFKNKEIILKKKKTFYKNNRNRLLKEKIKYNREHKVEKATYMRNRRRNNITFRLVSQLRTRIYAALNKANKSVSTMYLIGCDNDYLMYYLQCKFTKGMSWDNYGMWHVDHIRPCASFDMSKPEEQRKCFHYTNLQPLWAEDNRKKLSADFEFIRRHKNAL